MKRKVFALLVNTTVFLLGTPSLMAPFIIPQARKSGAQSASFPLMVSLIIFLCLLIIFFEAQNSIGDSKMIAFLGILIAINSGIRFLENAFPGPAGFSPAFFLIILTGYFFGSRVGFLMGALTMLVSALMTAGVGPWLPGQMITAGWVGQSAAVLKMPIKHLGWQDKPGEIVLLTVFGVVWGVLYGVIMNLWFWPFLAASPGITYSQAGNFMENFQRYTAYYFATSLVWDVSRAIGNLLIISTLSKPVLRIFFRFQSRFSFTRLRTPEP